MASTSRIAAIDEAEAGIQVHRLGKRFAGRRVLEQIAFTVAPGTICGLLGPNGAGKTTLLRCLTGYLAADFGYCRIGGVDPAQAPQLARQRFGYQADLPPLEPDLRVAEYLDLHGRLRGLDRRWRQRRSAELLATVALTPLARRLVGTLSRGQRSRLALAECLLHEPPVLLLDEPTSGLDPAQVVGLRQLLRRLGGAHTVLIATHHLPEAQAVCDQLVVLADGRVRFTGSPDELRGGQDLESAYLARAGAGA